MASFADLTDAEVEAKIVDSQKRAKEALKETRETFTTAEVAERLQAFAKALPKDDMVLLKVTEDCYCGLSSIRDVRCSANRGAVAVQIEGMRFYGRTLEAILSEAHGVMRADTGERLFTKRIECHHPWRSTDELWVEGAAVPVYWNDEEFLDFDSGIDKHAVIADDPAIEITYDRGRIHHWVRRNDEKVYLDGDERSAKKAKVGGAA